MASEARKPSDKCKPKHSLTRWVALRAFNWKSIALPVFISFAAGFWLPYLLRSLNFPNFSPDADGPDNGDESFSRLLIMLKIKIINTINKAPR
jgi:hypothetical protein